MLSAMPPDTLAYLVRKYPRSNAPEILLFYGQSATFVRGWVKPQFLIPGSIPEEFHALAVLRVHAFLAKTVRDSNAAWYGIWTLLEPFKK